MFDERYRRGRYRSFSLWLWMRGVDLVGSVRMRYYLPLHERCRTVLPGRHPDRSTSRR